MELGKDVVSLGALLGGNHFIYAKLGARAHAKFCHSTRFAKRFDKHVRSEIPRSVRELVELANEFLLANKLEPLEPLTDQEVEDVKRLGKLPLGALITQWDPSIGRLDA